MTSVPTDNEHQLSQPVASRSQGLYRDFALHTLGWKAFQDLCAHVCEEVLKCTVEIFREAQDGGQDAVFLSKRIGGIDSAVTVQCKFSSKHGRTIKVGDLKEEEEKILELRGRGEAETYVLMTSMSVGAPDALRIKHRLRELGVVKAHVLGREFLTRAIVKSPKLRALVPRVYGLGDLSEILDERRAQQTRALLGHMLPTLQVYVPTKPHVQAVRTLAEHGIVLLLGDAATGKSTIAAILATVAIDKSEDRCFKMDGPSNLLEHWNPDDPRRFFWVDDAFGPNQLHEDFVARWVGILPSVTAAIAKGNAFVLTSRKHIYDAAKHKLGNRNLQVFRDGRAIVHVGTLSLAEREQILYNHIKAGSQNPQWKERVKPQLHALASEPTFLPEIARRLADPAYTIGLTTANDALLNFIRNPEEHLQKTILELSRADRGALTLLYLHRGQMPVGNPSRLMQDLVCKHFSLDVESLGQALSNMLDSFVVERKDPSGRILTFKHPTIADALGVVLGKVSGMTELYLRGARIETLLADVTSSIEVKDALVVSSDLEPLLVERLAEVPDDPARNRSLFHFLAYRASENVFRSFIQAHPSVLGRHTKHYGRVFSDSKFNACARALKLGLLPSAAREEVAWRLETELFSNFDTSFLDDESLLALFSPRTLLRLSARVRDELLPSIVDHISAIEEEPDFSIEPEENFTDLSDQLDKAVTFLAEDHSAKAAIEEANQAISEAIERVRSIKRDIREDDDWEWPEQEPALVTQSIPNDTGHPRSIFSDVDE